MIANVKRSLWVAVGAVLMLSVGVFFSQATHAGGSNEPKKVYVCKYVGTPHVDERLQTGQNPISTAISSIAHNSWNGQVPGWFSDAHDRSYVIAYDIGQPRAYLPACPAPVGPSYDAVASVAVSKPTCDAPAKLTYGPATFATYSGTANNTVGPLTHYSVTATATVGHLFAINSLSTLNFAGSLDGKIGYQSQYPDKACFTPTELKSTVVTGDWVDGEAPCGAETVEETRSVTTTTHAYVFQDGHWVIKDGTPVVTEEHQIRALNENEIVQCPFDDELFTATASVKILDATCKTGETLVYADVNHAYPVEGSTPEGSVSEPTQYSVTFAADEDAAFAPEAQTTWSGTLAGPLTDPSCETGDVLGTSTSDPSDPADPADPAPAVLPDTTGESTTVIVLGGSLLAAVLGIAGARRFLARSL